jgi:hypothetical protein
MEGAAFASRFTAAMDCRGVYLAPAMAQRLDCARYHHLLDVAGGSGICACAIVARHPHLRATVLEKAPVDRLEGQALAERGFAERVSVATGDMFQCYSEKEMADFLEKVGFTAVAFSSTVADRSVITARKP